MSDTVRILVWKGKREEACATVDEFEFVDATQAQALAYANGDPAWREAKADTSWTSRLWRRVTG